MDSQFITSVRDKVNKKKKRHKIGRYSLNFLPILIVMFLYLPGISKNNLDSSSFPLTLENIYKSNYILTEEDILLYLIEEMDVDDFLGIAFENNLFEGSIMDERDI